ncbi:MULTISPECIES: AI-2E family transporter [unclassified Thalassospira]|jgi:predicted PurR-regulated permease PerM|uniref:AI-2E family transporter n=1 Tax=unclassified Thalassospira TaxID=2648997 RepID=UPI000A1EAE30|nr:AI-2E family transporter [Thalassospira sp. MCCC 1A01428]
MNKKTISQADDEPSPKQATSATNPNLPTTTLSAHRMVIISIIGIFLMSVCGVLYFAQSLLLPVVLAFLFALILSPVVRWLYRRGIPEPITAFVLVFSMVASIAAGGYWLSDPIAHWIEDAPRIEQEMQLKLAEMAGTIENIQEAQRKVEKATERDAKAGVQEVVVREPNLLSQAAQGAPEIFGGIALAVVLLLLMLASGDMFYEKLIKSLPTFKDKRRGLRIAKDIEREISRYLLTVFVINVCLGICVAIGLSLTPMPNPVLWGLAAALLNFVPYLGALVGIAIVAIVALVSLPTLGAAMVPPAIYLACTAIEGQLITPSLVGRRLQINSVAVFLAIAFWGWLWGAVGIFIAVPMLIIVKVFSHHIDGLGWLSEFLGARDKHLPADD